MAYCHHCQTTYRVKKELEGKRLRCKNCGQWMQPSSAPSGSMGEAKPKRRKRKKSTVPVLPIVAAFVVGVLGIVGFAVLNRSQRPNVQVGTPEQPETAQGQQQAESSTSLTVAESGGQASIGVGNNSSRPFEPDPAPEAESFPDDYSIEISVPEGSSGQVTYPDVGTAVVAVGNNRRENDDQEVWDLTSQTKIGLVNAKIGYDKPAISPDGHYLAALRRDTNQVLLFDTFESKQVAELDVSTGAGSDRKFLSKDRLAFYRNGSPLYIWEIPSGNLIEKINLIMHMQKDSFCCSPGGRYIAYVGSEVLSDGTRLFIRELKDGALIHKISLKRILKENLFTADTAFSPDGKEIALLTILSGKKVLVGIDLAAEKLVFQHSVDDKLSGISPTIDGPKVRWFPSGKRLLLYGKFLFDRDAGGPLWSLQDIPKLENRPVQIISESKLLVSVGPYNKVSLRTVDIPLEQIEQSATVVSSGGLSEDVGLPQLTRADYKGVKTLKIPDSAGWTAAADPQPVGIPSFSLDVRQSPESVAALMVVPGKVPVAIVAEKAGTEQTAVTIYQGGEAGDKRDLFLPYAGEVLDVDSEGKTLVSRQNVTKGRLDVWSVSTGEHIVGFRPFLSEEREEQREVIAAALLDEHHLLAISSGNKVVMFELPTCRAIYSFEKKEEAKSTSQMIAAARKFNEARDKLAMMHLGKLPGNSQPVINRNHELPVISPGGKFLAFGHLGRLYVMEANTGKVLGAVPTSGQVKAISFHTDGNKLAAIVSLPGSTQVMTVTMEDGRKTISFMLPVNASWIQWCDDDHVLLDHTQLVSLPQESVVWKYRLANASLSFDSPGNQLWGIWDSSRGPKLASLTIPDSATQAKVSGSFKKPIPILMPGQSISVKLDVSSNPPGDNAFATRIESKLKEHLAKAGLNVAPGQDVELRISVQKHNTGETINFKEAHKIFDHDAPSEVVAITYVECQIAMVWKSKEVWSDKAQFDNHALVRLFRKGESISKQLEVEQWRVVDEYFTNPQFPTTLYDPQSLSNVGESTLSLAKSP